MAARESVPRKAGPVYEPYNPSTASERILIAWLDSYGVSVMRPSPAAPPSLRVTEADPGLARVVIEEGESVQALMHESMHIWLSASGLSPAYLFSLPEALGERRMAYEYRRLSGLVSSVLEAEENLRAADILALRDVMGPPRHTGHTGRMAARSAGKASRPR